MFDFIKEKIFNMSTSFMMKIVLFIVIWLVASGIVAGIHKWSYYSSLVSVFPILLVLFDFSSENIFYAINSTFYKTSLKLLAFMLLWLLCGGVASLYFKMPYLQSLTYSMPTVLTLFTHAKCKGII